MSKILLVEDDSTLAMGIEYSLKQEGYLVDQAQSFGEGKKLVDAKQYQLIILDIGLPDGNGFELCQYIRQSHATPVIFLTAQDEEVNIVMGLDMGADDYITKPFRIKELISRIKAVLRRTEKASLDHHIFSGDMKIDLLEAKVFIRDKSVFLTPIEYKLLTIFMQHPHQILSRSKILELLWDVEGNYVDDNSLSVYIRRLREKIEQVPSQPTYIKTQRGMGYLWDREVRGE